jgi:hypothetical protein
MADFDPDLLGPITRPIWDQICTRLADLDPTTGAWLDHDQLLTTIAHELDANPKTVDSILDSGRRFGLIHGFRRIRPTTLGRHWLTTHHHSEQHAT